MTACAQSYAVKADEGQKGEASLLKRLSLQFEEGLVQVDQCISRQIASSVPLLTEVVAYLVQGPGKRLRPMMTLACADLLGYQGHHHIPLAASLELIHTATLLHDDVIDESPLRRGRKTAHLIWGEKMSILGGDFLFTQAFHLMMQQPYQAALRALARATSFLVEGEVLQLQTSFQFGQSQSSYFKVIEAKTAALFQAACHVAGIVAEASEQACESLMQYGRHLGMIFQIRDDLLDYETARDQGCVGDDFKEGKITLPLLICYERASTEEKRFLEQACDAASPVDQNWPTVLDMLDRHGVGYAVRLATQPYVDGCIQALKDFGHSAQRDLLEDLSIELGQCKHAV